MDGGGSVAVEKKLWKHLGCCSSSSALKVLREHELRHFRVTSPLREQFNKRQQNEPASLLRHNNNMGLCHPANRGVQPHS